MAQQWGFGRGGSSRGSTGWGGWTVGLKASQPAAWPAACEGGSSSRSSSCGQSLPMDLCLLRSLVKVGGSLAGVAFSQPSSCRPAPPVSVQRQRFPFNPGQQRFGGSALAAACWHEAQPGRPGRPGSDACCPAASAFPCCPSPLLQSYWPRPGAKEPNHSGEIGICYPRPAPCLLATCLQQ